MRNTLHIPFELKGALKDDGSFEGYGSTFGNVDLGKDRVVEGAFDRTLAAHKKEGTLPSMYFSHIGSEPIGDWKFIETDKKGLWGSGQLWIGKGIPKAEQAYMMMKGTGKKGLSIGYASVRSSYDDKKGIRNLEDVDLYEISPTSMPMNPKATVTGVKDASGNFLSKRELEQALRDVMGCSASEAKAFLAKGYAGLCEDREDASPELSGIKEELTKAIATIKS
jgi:uncharacterized protein